MRSFRQAALAAGMFALAGGLATAADEWTTIKGQIVLPKPVEPKKLEATADKEFCTSAGPLLDETIITGKTGGVKNLIVWLRPDSDDRKAEIPKDKINPVLAKAAPVERVIDQPCCQFIPRITAAKAGDKLLVKNSAKVLHNINMSADDSVNPKFTFNNGIPAGGQFAVPATFAAQRGAIPFSCNVHPWMKGYVRVFDHPYFAITDDDGNFEIKDAPQGKWRLVVWHENGFHNGAAGALGTTIDVKGTTLELPKTELKLPSPNP
jgi:plastocyanin